MDSSGISERINQIIEKEGLSISAFARRINIADQTVRSVCTLQRNKPGYDFLASIIHSFEWLDAEWLLTGKGEMKKTENEEKEINFFKFCSTGDPMKELVKYLREKDDIIKKLIEEKTEWKVRFEIMKEFPGFCPPAPVIKS